MNSCRNMITVVVPIFNMDQYLERCINSLLNQSYHNYEILLVDDGSTDDSYMICENYASQYPNIRVYHKINGGLSSARNAGIDLAQGNRIIFPDPDDWVGRDYLKELVDLQTYSDADLACTGHFVDYDNQCIPANVHSKKIEMTGNEAQNALLIPPRLNGFAWNKLYDLKIIKEHHLRFSDDVGTTEDLDFAYRYLKYCNKVSFDPQKRMYHYYQRDGAATHSRFSKQKLQSIRTYEKIIADTDSIVLKDAAASEICNTAINLLLLYNTGGTNDRNTEKLILSYIRQYRKQYIKSSYYGVGRKVQCIGACFIPKVYCTVKRVLVGGREK